MANERKLYAEACAQISSRLIDYARGGKDPAYAFQAYMNWREAVPMKEAAIDDVCNDSVRLSRYAENDLDQSGLVRTRQSMNRNFAELQEVLFRVLDEVVVAFVAPKPHAVARVNRMQAAYLMAEEARRRWDTGSTEQDVRESVAKRLSLTAANVRKLADMFHGEAGTQRVASDVFETLRRRLEANRRRAAPKKKRSASAHLWRK